MPTLDGLDAALSLAEEGLRRPVVIVTGIDDPGLIDRSVANGVDAYLTKPIDTRELDAALKLAAARHAELEALEEEATQARQALEDRKLVERAKGLLMSALQISEHDAFRRLQTTARRRNMRLADLARHIVEHENLLEPTDSSRQPRASQTRP
jgi:response regulator NasT